MTVVSGLGVLPIPDFSPFGTFSTTYTGLVIDAAAEKVAFVFEAPKAGNIARIGFRTGTVTVADDLRVSFQDVDTATGEADGVADQFRSVASAGVTANTWIRSGLVTSDGTDTGTLRAVARKERVVAVVEFNSFVAGNLQIVTRLNMMARGPRGGLAYVSHFTAAWAKQIDRMGVIAIEYDDGTFAYIPNTAPFSASNSGSFNTGTTPDEKALKFTAPMSVRADGFWVVASLAANAAFDAVLYDSNSNVVASASIDPDVQVNGTSVGYLEGLFTASVDLVANAVYRLAIKPTTANNVNMLGWTVERVGIWDQLPQGQTWTYSSRTDAGVWTAGDDPLSRPACGILASGVDVSSSGGGGAPVIHRGRGREVR